MSERPRLRVVVDTNLFVSSTIVNRGDPHRLVQLWKAGVFTLLISAEQREEIATVLQRPKIRVNYGVSASDIDDLAFLLATRAEPVVTDIQLPLSIRDPKDEMILATALNGGANFLVTGDQDFLVLGGDSRLGALEIVTVGQFLDELAD